MKHRSSNTIRANQTALNTPFHVLMYGCKHLLGEQTQRNINQIDIEVFITESLQKINETLIEQKKYFDIIMIGFAESTLYQSLIDTIKRLQPTAEIVFLAHKISERKEISLLNAGADHIVMGALSSHKILAYIHSTRRRLRKMAHINIKYKGINLNKDSRKVCYNHSLIHLTRREYDLLEALIESPAKIRTRDYLTHYIYGYSDDVDSNALEVHIHQLRKKISRKLIKTIRGIGYSLS